MKMCIKCLKCYNINDAPLKVHKNTLVKKWISDTKWVKVKFPVCPNCGCQWYYS